MDHGSSAAARRRGELAGQGRAAHVAAVDLLWRLDVLEELEYADEMAQVPSTDLRTLDGQLAILGGILRECLVDEGRPPSPQETAEIAQVLNDVHAVRLAVHDHLGSERLRRLDQLDRGLSRLRSVTDQDELLDIACEVAVEACGFERVMLSRVDDATWRPWRSHATTIGEAERAFAEWIRAFPAIELSELLLESELVRRKEPAMVLHAERDPRVYAPLARAAVLTSYVAAPVLSGDRAIGLLHADNRGMEMVELDRDVLWLFAIGFAQVFERAVLLERLREQRDQVRDAMRTVERVLDDVATNTIDLVTRSEGASVGVPAPLRPVATDRAHELEGLLTARELEVLGLMATGATNERIAHQLVIATGTVKSHVKQVLRKLRVENRAEAISFYLRSTIGARED
ncbi:LuxR family GAF modulated transcriptional regulator [Nocardioides sp. J9]|uniref:LuxR C-terminal-related transcriptional regulator n=1 Tax=Nocardioides sp. J9 TaxID=935844 RepID=UPI0011ABEF81|nr:LuxR C-terminal-related transcriptional regulator [Nocardioides sp. J9]TWH00916.1 LuxR family GAF modulated transcriptional regulator [Nocardioides sp. J9]